MHVQDNDHLREGLWGSPHPAGRTAPGCRDGLPVWLREPAALGMAARLLGVSTAA